MRSIIILLTLLAGVVSALLTFTLAVAGEVPSREMPDPVPRARWSEDWTVVYDNAPLGVGDAWRPPKYFLFGKDDEGYLSLGGEGRLAYELYDEADMGTSDVGRQDALQLRLAAHADWRFNYNFRLFGQLGWATVDDREGGAKTVDETSINIWQFFADGRIPVGGDGRIVLRLGRQLIETANVFITAGEAHNVRLYYDGLRIVWIDDEYVRLDAFAAQYVDYSDEAFSMSGTGEYFWGMRYGMRFREPEIDLSALCLGWDLKGRQFEQGGAGYHDERRHTLMLWMNRPLIGERQWGLDYYLAWQFGNYEDRPGGSDINAYAAFGEVRYALQPQENTFIAGLKTSYFSGDKDSTDSELNTFYNPVFGTPYFSYARDIMPFNLIQLQPNIGYRFGERLLLTFDHGFLWRAETSDAYYNSANGITIGAAESDSHWLGQQSQLAAKYRPTPNIIVTAYYCHFFAGDVITDAGGDDRDYVHIGINFLM